MGADGDLTGDVDLTVGAGCGEFDYGYVPGEGAGGNTPPTAAATADPTSAATGEQITFDAGGSTDAETPDSLDYSWDLGNGGSTKDAVGEAVTHAYAEAGTYTATVTVTDPAGGSDTAPVEVTVTGRGHSATLAREVRGRPGPTRPRTGGSSGTATARRTARTATTGAARTPGTATC